MCDRPNRKMLALALGLALGSAAALAFAYGKPQSQAKETAHLQSGSTSGDAGTASEPLIADRVIVRKAERRLYLMRGDTVLRTYRVALGLNPVGPKEQEGDSRTPEGHYQLTRRNPRSEYFLSIQVSYPNDKDLQRAHRNRLTPGGSIMIHGLPNELRREPAYYEQRDWTDGCIAVSDSDMLEIWLMTPQDTPIDILP
ncbi:MAG TPA: L,D-transpeptidase family protein [Steroidobacteraceae bacterium]|nr:L,D-transpeptidase family protein [Steroidobacteraceae bacterium]